MSNCYLAAWGGGSRDNYGKQAAGSLEVVGPFDTPDDVRTLASVLDTYIDCEWRSVREFAVVTGEVRSVEGAGISAPAEWLQVELCDQFEAYGYADRAEALAEEGEELVAALDRWLPDWERQLLHPVTTG